MDGVTVVDAGCKPCGLHTYPNLPPVHTTKDGRPLATERAARRVHIIKATLSAILVTPVADNKQEDR